jgi:hypothetical protein
MFLVRLRLFLDWHLALGHSVSLNPPSDDEVARHLSDMRLFDGLPAELAAPLPAAADVREDLLPLRRLTGYNDVEDAADDAVEVLRGQARPLAAWGNALLMAVGELCENALQHGRNDLGAYYVAADRIEGNQRCFRLAIADLGIGIPEHIRARYPEWQDDTAAITQVLERGVTGTSDPHRGNGFAEVIDSAVQNELVRAASAATIDIRSAHGHVSVELIGGHVLPVGWSVERPRRGTWITYTVLTVT